MQLRGRPRGVSMAYMENRSFAIASADRWHSMGVAAQEAGQDEAYGSAYGSAYGNGYGEAHTQGTGYTQGDVQEGSGAGVLGARAGAGMGGQLEGLAGDVRIDASQVCTALRERSLGGAWSYPNSGVFAGRVRAVRSAMGRLRSLVLRGHFEDQGMFGLMMLQHPRGAILLDGNATLFASQFAYNSAWWQRPACFDDYFDDHGEPPQLLATGRAPFALHFNGPAGRHRLGWCIATALSLRGPAGKTAARHYVDIDHDGQRVPLPTYCDGSGKGGEPAERASVPKGAAPPPGRRMATLPPCAALEAVHASNGSSGSSPWAAAGTSQQEQRPTPLVCLNDRCLTRW